ncbi:MAG: 30S ribosomal protein S1 [Gammaproteobacteria bacterium]|nr:MAG: 30S ribosomal protein S1 [Gammaproteobacteria bacterium]
MPESFAQLFEESLQTNKVKQGEIIPATIIKVSSNHITVDAGLKSESVIPAEQFTDRKGQIDIKEGDNTEVVLEYFEDGTGETLLSREKAKKIRSWEFLETALESKEIIHGQITGKVKGGFTVDTLDIHAFLPGSLVDRHPVKDIAFLEKRELDFIVIKLDHQRNNVVVSRKAVLEKENSAEREALMETLEKGKTVKGIVKNLTEYGAFLDLGGIDGLLYITDMAWRRVRHPSEVVEVGQELEVMVLNFDIDKNRISLGLKQMHEDPWSNLQEKYPVGSKIAGKVTNVTDYGCFVEIEPGIEGLVHVSEMDWTNKNVSPAKFIKLGSDAEVMILDIEPNSRRISLGIKQCSENPWNEFAMKYKKNDIIKGPIKSITDFGLFVGLEGKIDGLVHLSDLSWNESGDVAIKKYKRDNEVEVRILSISPESERISLGIKQLDNDPLSLFITKNPKGSIVHGTVKEVATRYAVIELAEDVLGKVKALDISSEKIEDVTKVLKIGDKIEAKFIAFDRKNRSISLSIKAKNEQEEKQAIADYASMDKEDATTSLGDILKDQMK